MIELCRGDVVFYGERGEYTGKLRPGVVVQHSATLGEAPSITLCGLTSTPIMANSARIAITPSPQNGLELLSFIMVDKIASISRDRIRQVFGKLETDDLTKLDRALRNWLEL